MRGTIVVVAALAAVASLGGAAPADAGVAAKALPMEARVLRAGDFLGFRPTRKPHVVRNPRTWAGRWGSTQALKRDGFSGGIRLRMRWPARDLDALSVVARFRSPRGAQHQLAALLGGERFRVLGIPNARGFVLRSGETVGSNVAFTNGRYLYLVSAGWREGHQRPVSIGQVADAARKLYRRVRGR